MKFLIIFAFINTSFAFTEIKMDKSDIQCEKTQKDLEDSLVKRMEEHLNKMKAFNSKVDSDSVSLSDIHAATNELKDYQTELVSLSIDFDKASEKCQSFTPYQKYLKYKKKNL